MLHCKDNLKFLKEVDSKSVDLIYLDPPFYSQTDYEYFDDNWESMTEYLDYIYARVAECRRILKPTGSLYLHCDDSANAYIRVHILDEIFGYSNFRSEIVWKRGKQSNSATKRFGRVNDTIYHYGFKDSCFNIQYWPLSQEYIDKGYTIDDNDGRGVYRSRSINKPSAGGYFYDYKGYKPPSNGWLFPITTMERLDADNRIIFPRLKTGRLREKLYLSERKGIPMTNNWVDIHTLQPGKEYTGYATQKPLLLLERIIKASSNENDLVCDPFLGAGTTAVACKKLGRKFIGCDINPESIEITKNRLDDTSSGLMPELN